VYFLALLAFSSQHATSESPTEGRVLVSPAAGSVLQADGDGQLDALVVRIVPYINHTTCLEVTVHVSTVDAERVVGTCLEPEQTVRTWVLDGLPPGRHEIAVRRAEGAATAEDSVTITVERARPLAGFVPSYAWRDLAQGEAVPAGLDVELPLDGRRKRARIPPTWRLQLWVEAPARGCKAGFWREDVTRTTIVAELAASLTRWEATRCAADAEAPVLELAYGDLAAATDPLHSLANAEEVDLFGHVLGRLLVVREPYLPYSDPLPRGGGRH
jgi:hypothetical protein